MGQENMGPEVYRTGSQLAYDLHMQVNEVETIQKMTDRPRGWISEPNCCHENVGKWTTENPSHRAVRGWLVEKVGSECYSVFYFSAHTVVEKEIGSLWEITLCERLPPFLRHKGSDAEFAHFAKAMPRVQYPPSTSLCDVLHGSYDRDLEDNPNI